jgi:hypothetical protein
LRPLLDARANAACAAASLAIGTRKGEQETQSSPVRSQKAMEAGSPPCSPQMPSLRPGALLAAAFGADLHQRADAFLVDRDEGVDGEDALLHIGAQEGGGIVAADADGRTLESRIPACEQASSALRFPLDVRPVVEVNPRESLCFLGRITEVRPSYVVGCP